MKLVDPVELEAVSVTEYIPVTPYVTIGFCKILPVGEAVAPKFQFHPVGPALKGRKGLVSLNPTVPPGTMVTEEVNPVALVKLV